jgi:hypothetical protein
MLPSSDVIFAIAVSARMGETWIFKLVRQTFEFGKLNPTAGCRAFIDLHDQFLPVTDSLPDGSGVDEIEVVDGKAPLALTIINFEATVGRDPGVNQSNSGTLGRMLAPFRLYRARITQSQP